MNTHQCILGVAFLAGSLSLSGCARTSIVAEDAPLLTTGNALVAAQAQPAAAQAQPAAGDQQAFQFPADKGGQALGQLLRPPQQLPGDGAQPGPQPLAPPLGVAQPEVALTPVQSLPPSVPLPRALNLQPRLLAEGAPFTGYRDEPGAPGRRELASGAPIALPRRDLNQPVPLGYLGLQLPDRVPVDDPTGDASVDAALAATPPARTDAVPFAPHNLPDPFQNAQTVKLRTPPPEDPTPSSSAPRPPRP
ncbi:MAG: hypothetical protein JNM56_13125 [Planctomycetia bacterium]|nr:hypothetical protein [Planctomycetia bacterium]